ncbi:GNAT family N-acetyltransferase [Streptomyces microflavus]|uniref:GNAT family N-acetyltransferase n=1 Tax=Streptomyces microflavus TaxID=1919 RepID=UPI00365207AF
MPETFPETTLRSERLTLRPFSALDIPGVQVGCSDTATQRWLPLARPYTRDNATTWCTVTAHALRQSGDGIHFAVTGHPSARLVANVGLRHTDWDTLTTEIGYWVAPGARGDGIATEAVRRVAEWLFTERSFERLELRAAEGNTASRRVAVKAGMTQEGVLRSAGVTHGGRVNLVLFACLPDETVPGDDVGRRM